MKSIADFNAENTDAANPERAAASKGAGEPGEDGGPVENGRRCVTGPTLRPLAKAVRHAGAGPNIFERLRIITGWTQVQAAVRFGVSERFWRDLEKGKEPGVLKLLRGVLEELESHEGKRRTG